MDKLVIPYEILNYVLTDIGTQFISKLVKSLCIFLGARHKKLWHAAAKERASEKPRQSDIPRL